MKNMKLPLPGFKNKEAIARTRGVRYDLLVASLRSSPRMHAPPAPR